MRRALPAVLAAFILLGAPALADAAKSCSAEIGASRSAELVRRCTLVSPATRPPCNATNPCNLIRSEIRRGCEIVGTDAPAFCKSYRTEEDDDEDDDADH